MLFDFKTNHFDFDCSLGKQLILSPDTEFSDWLSGSITHNKKGMLSESEYSPWGRELLHCVNLDTGAAKEMACHHN